VIKTTTKERILMVAIEEFADRGFAATTLKGIALRVGIKTASLYAHYESKEAIFRVSLAQASSDWESTLDAVFSEAGKINDLREGILALTQDFALKIARSDAYRFWGQIYISPPKILRAEDIGRFKALDSAFALRLAEYAELRLPEGCSEGLVHAFCETFNFTIMGLLVDGIFLDEKDMRSALERCVDFLLRALAR